MPYAPELICDTLERLGATAVFGMAGSQNVPIFEALRTSNLRTVATTSELAAAFAANGFYRASGKVGVLTTIPGPGFTFALSGLTEARLDSAAVLLITSSVAGNSGRKFQNQQIHMEGIAAAVVKEVYPVENIEDLVPVLARAYHHATSGEPGPVMVLLKQTVLDANAEAPRLLVNSETMPIDPDAVKAVAGLMAQSRRTVLYLGQGCASVSDKVRLLAERLNAPVMTTCSGRGVLPEDHRLSLAFDYGMGGGIEVNACIGTADLVLALGCKFSQSGSAGFRLRIPKEKLVHVDASAEVVGANYAPQIGIVGDVGVFIEALLSQMDTVALVNLWTDGEIQHWRMRFQQERSALLYCLPVIQGKEPLSCETFFDAMRRSLPDDACIAIDAGYHQMLGRQFLRVKSVRGLIVPSDFQSMGFAIPAAVGAAVAVPHRKTLALVGDGGMAITGLELLTAVRENLNLTVIVFNDGYLGLIRRNQIENSGREHAVRLQNPDFEMLAGAIGANYFTLDNSPDVVFHQCFNTPGVNLLEVFLNDAPSMRRSRIRGLARSAVRKTIPPSQFGRLKKLLHRC